MTGYAEWNPLLNAPPLRAALRPSTRAESTPAAVLIAGIPGSGADDLVELLRALAGCTVHDEPAGLAPALAARAPPAEVAAYVRDTRREHGAAEIIVIRNTLAFLCRLDALEQVLPEARIVVCVRNPFDTIAQWKARPPDELDEAMASVAASAGNWATEGVVAALRRIAGLSDAAEKRAAWWWWLAQRALGHADGVAVVRYGEVSADSGKVLGRILAGTQAVSAAHGSAPVARHDRVAAPLDEQDLQAIRAICLQAAAQLGVSERGS